MTAILKAQLLMASLSNVPGGYRAGIAHTVLDAADGRANGEFDRKAFDLTRETRAFRDKMTSQSVFIPVYPQILGLDPATASVLRAYTVGCNGFLVLPTASAA